MRQLIERALSRARHHRRGVRPRARRRRIRLGARPDRRHQILHQRRAAVRHADRADAARPADARHHRPADLARALGRRRRAHDHAQRHADPLPRLPGARRRDDVRDHARHVQRRRCRRLRPRRRRGQAGRFGADCYAYGLVALGFIDLVIEASLKPYDFCAMVPIVEGAGGIVTDWQGAPLGLALGRPGARRRRPRAHERGAGAARRGELPLTSRRGIADA